MLAMSAVGMSCPMSAKTKWSKPWNRFFCVPSTGWRSRFPLIHVWYLTTNHSDMYLPPCLQAFGSPNLPSEVLQTLLNLAEFMEHDEKPLPIDIRALGALAANCQAYAKALHYKELEFQRLQRKVHSFHQSPFLGF